MDSVKAEQLIKEYIPIVKGIATNMGLRYSSIQYNDCIQSGRLAIIDAIEKYDKKKGKLSSYIHMVCRSAMFDTLYGNGRDAILYGNLQTHYSTINNTYAPKYISYDANIEFLSECLHTHNTSIDDIDRQELITTFKNYLVLNFGIDCTELLLRAFAGTRASGVIDDYEYIAKNYELLKKHYVKNSTRGANFDGRRMWNIRRNVLRMVLTALKRDGIGDGRRIPIPK